MKGSSVQRQKGSLLRGEVTNVNRKWSLPLEMVNNWGVSHPPFYPTSIFKTDVTTKIKTGFSNQSSVISNNFGNTDIVLVFF